MPDLPKTLIEAVAYFADPAACDAYMRRIKWADGQPVCPKCGADSVSPVKGRPALQCNTCRCQFTLKAGTIFEDSPLPLGKWFVAVWAIANCRNGISSHELARAIGVTQKTAWFMLHRIRLAMETESFDKMGGEVESDETFVGGESRNMHAHKREKVITGRGAVNKAIVQGLLQRGGEVRTFVVPNTDGPTLRRNVLRNVDRRAAVYTDAHPSYDGLSRSFLHQTIDHATAYVRGAVHTNGLENFWSILKRAIKGTYTHVAPFHLHRYASEQAYRHGVRRLSDLARFHGLMQRVLGKRLTYRRLCAIGDAGFMGLE